ncbi:MAG: hypothetical protein L3J88_08140 [Gammaproteobacteria bacterium]|nr:hypothetical protein [Gammaproteobacteria bacterium]MCF6363300.1 hypothetical protein [Gammaproteobacteria bacterium]
MSNSISPLNLLATSPVAANKNGSSNGSSWYEAMAEAWGQSLDAQAGRIEDQAKGIGNGIDNPSAITQLTAESLKMSFMANSSQTSLSSVGSALETMARKQ